MGKIGLVLSGGMAKGAYQAGALCAINEYFSPTDFDYVSSASIGTLNTSPVHPREVFKQAIRHSACNVILSHNHPSGDCMPSELDIEITERLVETGNIIGIPVIDHIIVGEDSYYSFSEHKLL